MKTITGIFLLLCFYSSILYGQVNQSNKLFSDKKSDTLIAKPLFKYPDLNLRIEHPNILKPNSDLSKRQYQIQVPEINNSSDKILAERFPGSEKFYAKRPYVIYPYEKSFIVKPDTSVHYYLIIKDPITQRRTN